MSASVPRYPLAGRAHGRFAREIWWAGKKAHRVRLGLTQEALAERAGISTDMVSKIEGGSSGARFGVIAQLANALGIDPRNYSLPICPMGS